MRDLRSDAIKDSTERQVICDDPAVSLVWIPGELTVQSPERPMIEHVCVCGDGERALNAVFIHPDHVVTGERGSQTITPSVLCTLCGLHGFLTAGVWRNV